MSLGKFIVFEGGEGSGKSTQCQMLVDRLNELGIKTIKTREPGGSKGAEEIRSLIVKGDADRWDDITELLLFNAARRDHMMKTIIPAINSGITVVSDRFSASTLAYQGYAGSIPVEMVKAVQEISIGSFKPDLSLYLDIDPKTGLQRANNRMNSVTNADNRFEQKDFSYHERIRKAFIDIFKNDRNALIINANNSVSELSNNIIQSVVERLFSNQLVDKNDTGKFVF